jgi:hypothetical protein
MLRTVVLYGKSLVLSSIGATLRDRPDLQVLVLDPNAPGAAERLRKLATDVVVFDQATTHPQLAIPLCEANPDLLLIAVDFRTSQALVLSSRSSPVLTTDDLVRVIDAHGPCKKAGERELKSEQEETHEVQKA